mmetsp:Transcript_97420/g.280350  ORF Transcript_97420/g.280350 Transcript_97420/m.280350 type:complete len:83 (-) Transcript_97420:183-431(-)
MGFRAFGDGVLVCAVPNDNPLLDHDRHDVQHKHKHKQHEQHEHDEHDERGDDDNQLADPDKQQQFEQEHEQDARARRAPRAH